MDTTQNLILIVILVILGVMVFLLLQKRKTPPSTIIVQKEPEYISPPIVFADRNWGYRPYSRRWSGGWRRR
jgi:hypothetical protein